MSIINVSAGYSATVNYRPSPNQTASTAKPASNGLTDAFIPGYENQYLDRFTYYLPTTGGTLDYRTGTFKPGYIAVTTINPDASKNANITSQTGLLTVDQFDTTQPGAVWEGGQWSLVPDFVAKNTKQGTTEPTATITDEVIDKNPIYLEISADQENGWRMTSAEGISFVGKFARNVNPTQWTFPEGNQAFETHDILNAIDTKVDEYGYQYSVPGYTRTEQPNGASMLEGENLHGADGNLRTSIQLEERIGYLKGLTLEERDLYWNTVQSVFAQYGIKADARKESYGYSQSVTEVSCGDGKPSEFGNWYWISENFDKKTLQIVNEALKTNHVLNRLSKKMEAVQSGAIADDTLAQQYSIRVTDADGRLLDNNRILIEAKNGNSLVMSVADFEQLDRKAITALLR